MLAGRPLVSMAQADIVVEGRIARAGADFESTLTLVSREGGVLGTRRLTTAGPECGGVTGEVGLVIALMIDPDAVLRPGAPAGGSSAQGAGSRGASDSSGAGSGAASPSSSGSQGPFPGQLPASDLGAGAASGFGSGLLPAAPPCPPPAPPATPPAPWRAQLSAGPVIGFGLSPSPGIGGRFRLAVTPPGVFPFEVGADLFAPVRVEQEGVGLDVFVAQGHVRACPLTGTFTRWGLVACGGVDLGALRGGGFGFPVERAAELFMAGASLAGRVQVHLGPLFVVSLGLDLSVPFVRARFTYAAPEGGRRELFLTSPVAGSADLGLGLEM